MVRGIHVTPAQPATQRSRRKTDWGEKQSPSAPLSTPRLRRWARQGWKPDRRGDLCGSQPLPAAPSQIDLGCAAARDGDLGTFAFGIGHGTFDEQLHTVIQPGDVRHIEADQFGAEHGLGEADQEQRAVAGIARSRRRPGTVS